MLIHEKLKKYINYKGYKQKVVAEKCGMNIKTFNAILNGQISLKADTLIVICQQGLGIKPEKFLRLNSNNIGI